ncbi:malto-oligosyltrehalose trehalohydrolase [Methylocaldum sp. 14B]|uniref:malto-oligosyltrehalose trehalohydrolase n=1 Tax=Methylocaldum sp. 14B TaxID=1912213 RepID=UPI00098BA748|nr:malto-oligosyltrehalose trehalohydrolase [Methylocaldum sp. 14B]
MPFGTEITEDGVRFRFWAPQTKSVDLILGTDERERRLTMQQRADGWFEVMTTEAAAGSRYRFRLDDGLAVPDPASRFNPSDVHGASQVIDPAGFRWTDEEWTGRPWEEAVIYELHVGTFTPEGSFRALQDKLDYLASLGITAIELMPIAAFPGRWNWGYDGVLPFAPDASYGTPDDLKEFVQAAHHKGLMVFLDVVYNHFGPEGNYLYVYGKPFFSNRHHTPWGSAINYDGENCRTVRDFFIHNALYWLEEYHLDGLRLDAVHAIIDDSRPDILDELAERVRAGPGSCRHVHLVLENDDNAAHYLAREADGSPRQYDAQWNDDLHHALHLLLTGETDGYYADYADAPLKHLGRALTEGFAYQGEASPYRDNRRRGEISRDLPPTAFVPFLQNHDQVGNRAFGERLSDLVETRPLRAAVTLLLLAPSPPLLFMGEEFACPTPFQYFCDFGPELAQAVTEGRRNEFARFGRFAAPELRQRIPDPSAPSTFFNSKLDWAALEIPKHREWQSFYQSLLAVRREQIVPILKKIRVGCSRFAILGGRGLSVVWNLDDGGSLILLSNLGEEPLSNLDLSSDPALAVSDPDITDSLPSGRIPAWSTAWFLMRPESALSLIQPFGPLSPSPSPTPLPRSKGIDATRHPGREGWLRCSNRKRPGRERRPRPSRRHRLRLECRGPDAKDGNGLSHPCVLDSGIQSQTVALVATLPCRNDGFGDLCRYLCPKGEGNKARLLAAQMIR